MNNWKYKVGSEILGGKSQNVRQEIGNQTIIYQQKVILYYHLKHRKMECILDISETYVTFLF